MNLSKLRTEARSIFNQTDPNNSQITESQLDTWANEGYRTVVARMGSIPEITYDLTSALGDISISTDVLTLQRAYMLKQPDNKYSPLLIIGPDVLEQSVDKNWLSAEADIPMYLVRKSTFTVRLHPQPNDANLGQSIKLDCISFPTPLSSDEDEPNLPKNLIDIIPHYMAYRALQQMGQDQKSTNEIIFVNTQLKANKEISTRFIGSELSMKWANSDND